MSAESKEFLYQQLKTTDLQIEEIISKYLTDENVKNALLHYIDWLKANELSPTYLDFEGQSPIWEVEYKGKKHYIVWYGKDGASIMIQANFSAEYQAIIRENNLQDIVLKNLQYCSRASGDQCDNCHLPPDVAGVDEVIFGKEVKNLCCGQYITFNNPGNDIIEGIKKLVEY